MTDHRPTDRPTDRTDRPDRPTDRPTDRTDLTSVLSLTDCIIITRPPDHRHGTILGLTEYIRFTD
jgi:hypothetical protein